MSGCAFQNCLPTYVTRSNTGHESITSYNEQLCHSVRRTSPTGSLPRICTASGIELPQSRKLHSIRALYTVLPHKERFPLTLRGFPVPIQMGITPPAIKKPKPTAETSPIRIRIRSRPPRPGSKTQGSESRRELFCLSESEILTEMQTNPIKIERENIYFNQQNKPNLGIPRRPSPLPFPTLN